MESIQVDILMAVYNGSRFLEEQLRSIAGQSFKNWKLYIRDDGSSDNSLDITTKFAKTDPERIVIVEGGGNLGARGNFSRLMSVSTAPYVAFSDQDDIWMPEKLEKMLAQLIKLENGKKDVPAFLFSDLTMIRDDGSLIAESLWKYDRLVPDYTSLGRLLVQNVPYGCATMINRSLLALSTPIDDRALLHDHWMALLAAAAGRIGYLNEPTIKHRIHDMNASRSRNPIRIAKKKKLNSRIRGDNFRWYLSLLRQQAEAVSDRLKERQIEIPGQQVLDDFITLDERSALGRKITMIRRGYFKHSPLQSAKWIIRI